MKRAITLAVLFTAGCAAALSLGVTRASAWDWTNLPNGYSVSDIHTTQCEHITLVAHTGEVFDWPNTCAGGDYQAALSLFIQAHPSGTFDQTVDDVVTPSCDELTVSGHYIGKTCLPGFQNALDSYIDSTICTVNPAAGGSACAPTTTAPPATTTSPPGVTTTVVITTTTPAATTAAPADTTAPAAQPAATTGVATVVTTATPLEQSLQAQIDALAAQISAVTDRVSRLEKASDAAWLAYQQAIEAGDSAAVAAEIARGTAMNVIYGLGAFAP